MYMHTERITDLLHLRERLGCNVKLLLMLRSVAAKQQSALIIP